MPVVSTALQRLLGSRSRSHPNRADRLASYCPASEVETSEPEPTPPKDPDMDACNLVHRVCMQLNETQNWCSRACSGV